MKTPERIYSNSRLNRDPMKNPYLLPIAAGLVLFALAYWDSTYVRDYNYQNWFGQLSIFGKLCTIGFAGCIVWLFALVIGLPKLFKRRKR